MSDRSRRGSDHPSRLARAAAVCGARGKLCPAERATQLLEAIIEPGDRVAIEGDHGLAIRLGQLGTVRRYRGRSVLIQITAAVAACALPCQARTSGVFLDR